MKIFFFFWIWKTWIFQRNGKFWLMNFFWIFWRNWNFDLWCFFFFEKFGNLEYLKKFDWWFFFFFGSNLRSTSPMPLVPRPFLKISFFFFFERFTKNWFFFFWNMKICSLSKSEEDEDNDGVKVMNIYSWWFFFFWKTYPLNENNFGWKLLQIVG